MRHAAAVVQLVLWCFRYGIVRAVLDSFKVELAVSDHPLVLPLAAFEAATAMCQCQILGAKEVSANDTIRTISNSCEK